MNIAVWGSGFGLYGYVPAIIEEGYTPVITFNQAAVLRSRPDIEKYYSRSLITSTTKQQMERAHFLCVVVNPAEQPLRLKKELVPNIKYISLEKPVAPCPSSATELLINLLDADIKFKTNYSFLYTEWFSGLDDMMTRTDSIHVELVWTFMAHHNLSGSRTWKNEKQKGGGVLSFYAIHLLAVAVRFLQDESFEITDLRRTEDRIDIVLETVCKKRSISISVDSKAPDNFFRCSAMSKLGGFLRELQDPFGAAQINHSEMMPDRRIGFIRAHLRHILELDQVSGKFEQKVIELWERVESFAS